MEVQHKKQGLGSQNYVLQVKYGQKSLAAAGHAPDTDPEYFAAAGACCQPGHLMYIWAYDPLMRKLLLLLFLCLSAVAWSQDSAVAKKDTPWVLYHSIEARLDTVYGDDQSGRQMIETMQKKYGMRSRQLDSLYKAMGKKDSINRIKVKGILGQYGWLGINEIGEKANLAIFLVIQHSDSLTQVTYLPVMRQAVKDKKARAADLALLEDRVLCMQGKPQLYGSQVRVLKTGKYALFPIQDEPNVDRRRAEVGLEPLEAYARYFGIDYHLPK